MEPEEIPEEFQSQQSKQSRKTPKKDKRPKLVEAGADFDESGKSSAAKDTAADSAPVLS